MSSTADPYTSLLGDARCEVLILGGGVTGALVAHELLKHGVSTMLVDKHSIGHGSTAASTGLLQYEVDTPLVELIKHVGQQHATAAYRRGLAAIDDIEEIISALSDSCEFTRHNSLYFASHFWHYRALKREYDCRLANGFDVDFLTRKQLADISTLKAAGAIRSRGDAQINPLKFTQQLVASTVRRGLRVFTDTRVVEVEERDDGIIVKTSAGVIQADAIAFATGYSVEHIPTQPKFSLNSTYAAASQANLQVEGWPDECLIWETARPYFYARRTADGRAIIGGEDSAFANDHDRDQLVERRIQRLVKRFQQLFPGAEFRPEYSWAGTFAETQDGLAYIGQVDDRPRAYFALGYGGNGITFSTVAAKIISDLYTGTPNADAEIFRFAR